MLATDVDAASALLWGHWQGGTTLASLPDLMRPTSRTEGYDIQSRFVAKSANPIAGWKIAATSKGGQAHIGVDGPLIGRLLSERVHQDGAVVRFGANRMAVAELEFCFRMGSTLEPQAQPYSVDEVLDAVEALHLAVELPDSRFSDFTSVGESQLLADNACAHEFVLGPATTADWRNLDLASHGVVGIVTSQSGERVRAEGKGENVLGDPRIALAWAANELSALSIPLAAGHLVTTGTCVIPMAIAPFDLVEADFGLLGTMSVRLGQ